MLDSERKPIRERFINGFNRQLLFYLDTCTCCGACKDACHIYRGTGKTEFMPSRRADLLRRLYHRSIFKDTLDISSGKNAGLTDQYLEDLFEAAYTCTGCRRCMVFCPFGIDLTWVIGLEKAILIAAGKVPDELELLTETSIARGENIDLCREMMKGQVQNLEQELRELSGIPDAVIPMGIKGAKVLYVPLDGKDSIILPSVVFNLAGEDWTLSEYEASNFGYFLGDTDRALKVAERIVGEARELGVKEVVIAECGHAYRVMRHLYQAWSKRSLPFRVKSVFEPWADYIREGRIKVDPHRITETVTYHDPCQLGRNGGIYREPREVIRAVAGDFREMTPNREQNWCCGGGGGLIARDGLEEFRAAIGGKKAEQIRASGAKIVAAPCGNCRHQLNLLNQHYRLGVEIVAVVELLVRALVPSSKETGLIQWISSGW